MLWFNQLLRLYFNQVPWIKIVLISHNGHLAGILSNFFIKKDLCNYFQNIFEMRIDWFAFSLTVTAFCKYIYSAKVAKKYATFSLNILLNCHKLCLLFRKLQTEILEYLQIGIHALKKHIIINIYIIIINIYITLTLPYNL